MSKLALIAEAQIEQIIFLVRGQKVMLDSALARLYGVKTKEINKAVKRNPERFPVDFVFRLTSEEAESLRFQIGTSNAPLSAVVGRGGRRYLPYVFTEQGVAMLSSVLRSKRSALVNVAIMQVFVKLRRIMVANKDLSLKLAEMEKKYDYQFKVVFEIIDQLMEPELSPDEKIGFTKIKGFRA